MSLSFGILSTYPPTTCALATFSQSLAAHLNRCGSRTGIVRVVDGIDDPAPTSPYDGVIHHLRSDSRDVVAAAAALSMFDVAIVQHEFDIYGGRDGADVVGIMERLTIPVIVVVNTVLSHPTRHQREVFNHVIRAANAVVALSVSARDRLLDLYDVELRRVFVIPHGALPSAGIDERIDEAGAPTILTWGMLVPGKGIEMVIDALPAMQSLDPQPRYQVVGPTHPKVLARDGEIYRHELMARSIRRGVARQVRFDGRYLDAVELNQVVARADVVVLPYQSREQVISHVLAETVAAAKPVVATAFPHAIELLSGGAGLIVPHDDPVALAGALRRVLTEPGLAAAMAGHSAIVTLQLRWPAIAAEYQRLARSVITAPVVAA